MSEFDGAITRIPLQVTRECLVASIQVDLTPDVLRRFQEDLLARIERTHARGVLLDLSGIEIMDGDDFDALRRVGEMARLMGAPSIMVGLRPGIVAALVDLDVAVDGMMATLDLESAFEVVASMLRPPPVESAADPDEAADNSNADGT